MSLSQKSIAQLLSETRVIDITLYKEQSSIEDFGLMRIWKKTLMTNLISS